MAQGRQWEAVVGCVHRQVVKAVGDGSHLVAPHQQDVGAAGHQEEPRDLSRL